MNALRFAVAGLASLFFLAMGKPPTPASGSLTLNAVAWNIQYSEGTPPHPAANPSGGWYFDIPRYDAPLTTCNVKLTCPGVHYVVTGVSGILGKSLAVSGAITVRGTPAFQYKLNQDNTCDSPAAVHLYVQQQGDDMSGQGKYEFYRWWSNPLKVVLAPGPFALAVPLTPDQWTSVFGKQGTAATVRFAEALKNAGNIGMTFGGGCAFGHGVNVSAGNARFVLTSYRVE